MTQKQKSTLIVCTFFTHPKKLVATQPKSNDENPLNLAHIVDFTFTINTVKMFKQTKFSHFCHCVFLYQWSSTARQKLPSKLGKDTSCCWSLRAAASHIVAKALPEQKKLTCHLFVMILSPLSYLHIKALIKIMKGQNALFKTHSKTWNITWFIFYISH